MKDIIIVDNKLQPEDFIRLRLEAGFMETPMEQAEKALSNGLLPHLQCAVTKSWEWGGLSETALCIGISRMWPSCLHIRAGESAKPS